MYYLFRLCVWACGTWYSSGWLYFVSKRLASLIVWYTWCWICGPSVTNHIISAFCRKLCLSYFRGCHEIHLVLQHCWVNLMWDLMQRRPNVRNCPHDIQLHFIGIGGARLDLTNDSHCIFRYMNRLRAVRPNIVYVHIGENYLSNMGSDDL